MNWQESIKWERQWWGRCLNTTGEELKQTLYARKMGLHAFHNGKGPYNYDLQGKSVLDIGGGPVSLLLKCVNGGRRVVVDPCNFPKWVTDRYKTAKIEFVSSKAEGIIYENEFDEVWLYNCLQHTEDPEKIIANIRRAGKLIRIFEWLNTGITDGHIHSFSEDILDKWLGGCGKTEYLDGEDTLYGTCYYGIFKGEWYQ